MASPQGDARVMKIKKKKKSIWTKKLLIACAGIKAKTILNDTSTSFTLNTEHIRRTSVTAGICDYLL